MVHIADFILELGVEELPIDDQQDLVASLAANLSTQFTENALDFSTIEEFSTPRRLSVIVYALSLRSKPQIISKRGPLINNTAATAAFANSLNVEVGDLKHMDTEKGTYSYYEKEMPGIDALEVLPQIIHSAVEKLNVKKRMRWANQPKGFVRPVHWILAQHGTQIVPACLFNVTADKYTYGHRFHSNQPLEIPNISDYEQILLEHKVRANRNKRKEYINEQLFLAAKQHSASPIIDEELLDIVTNLTEFPVILCATFNESFLVVPKECLISSMQQHQKCFALVDSKHNLLPKFLLVSNIQSNNSQTVISGNELVMNARLHDAAFHFNFDKNKTLESRVAKLHDIAFDQKLGSIYDKLIRIQKIAAHIAQELNIDPKNIEQSSMLSKADLTTNMVNEFPELQGIMGKYYAQFDGVAPIVCEAIEQHYWPKSASDQTPTNQLAICVGLADRLDTLAGLFSVGKAPTGEKDPYGLRRQALAIMRIITESKLPLDLKNLFKIALNNFKTLNTNEELIETLITFCFERLKNLLIKNDIASVNEINAVLNEKCTQPYDFMLRLHAVVAFKNIPQAASLAAANKRVKNMLNKTTDYNNTAINEQLMQLAAEQDLYNKIIKTRTIINPLITQQEYAQALIHLADLKEPIDRFFDDVLINVENIEQKHNRLALLKMIRDLFLEIADISALS